MPTTEETQLFGDEVMGFTSSQEPQLFGDEAMGFGPEPQIAPESLQYPGAAVAGAMSGAPVAGNLPAQGLETAYRVLKGLYNISPIGLSFKTTQAALGAIPKPSQEQLEGFVKRTRESGGAFGGGFEGAQIPGISTEESDKRQAAFLGAVAEEAKGVAQFTATPTGAALTVLGGPVAGRLGPVARSAIRRLINLGFTADIARNVPDKYQNWLVAEETGTPEQQERASVELWSSVGMLGTLAAHQAKGIPEFLGKVPEVFETAQRLGLERATREAAAKVAPTAQAKIAVEKPAIVPKPEETPGLVISPSTVGGQRVYHYTNPDIPGAKRQTFMLPADAAPEMVDARVQALRAPEAQGALIETPTVAPEAPAKAPETPGAVPIPPAITTPVQPTPAAPQAIPAEVRMIGGMQVVLPKGERPSAIDPRTTAGTPWTPEELAEWLKESNTPLAQGQITNRRIQELQNLHGGLPPPTQQLTTGVPDAGKIEGTVGVVRYTPAQGIEAVATGTPSRLPVTEGPRPETPETQKVGDQSALQRKEAETPVVSPAETPTTSPTPAVAPVPAKAPVGVEGGIPGASPISTAPTPAPLTPAKTGGILSKWVSATEDRPLGSEAGFFTLDPLKQMWDRYTPSVKDAIQAVKEVYNENRRIVPTTDRRRSLLEWSGKMQTSFNEAASAQRDIETKVRNPVRRDAISNWIEAGGDARIIQQRLDATKSWVNPNTGKPHPDKKNLVAGYEAALNLTPEELAVAADVKRVYDTLGRRGQSNDVLGNFVDNYITHIWNMMRGESRRGGMGAGQRMLKDRFQFAKARTFKTFFDGEQAGWVPKTKDVSKLLPAYMHEMNSVIAARQLVARLSEGKEIDGRPIFAAEGIGFPIEGEKGKATLILPDMASKEYSDYVKFPKQPALHAWRWSTKDSAGNPVFLKANLAVHPRVAPYLNAALGKSKIRQWYSTKTSATAEIPKAIVKSFDWMQSETKRTMLGLLAPFHQVQEGTHAWGHRVNPFWGNPTLDLANNAMQRDAVTHGLMLAPDMASKDMFMEGFRHSGLVSKIPGIGPIADRYSHYLFHDYIPGLKYRTYEKIYQRNSHVYKDELARGTITPEDIKILSAEQANAAYGHLNYADLGRSPTVQHFMRLTMLAPDFLEARMRFTGQAVKGLAGQKVGREQVIALGFLAASQAVTAWTMAQLTGGQWDAKDPFAFHVGNRKFTMRSVPEDLLRLGQDPRAFIYARLSPLLGRGTVQYLSGTDWRGRKVTGMETAKELAMQPLPLTLRALLDTANSPLSEWEQLLASSGIIIKRYSAQSEIRKKAHDWMYESIDPRIKAAEERYRQETFADSDYKPMREALINNDYKEAAAEYAKLLQTKKPDQIDRTMTHSRPITGNSSWDIKFRASLSAEDKILFEQAMRERKELQDRYMELKKTIQGPATRLPISKIGR